MIQKQIESFKTNTALLAHLTTALSLLHQSGVLSFLRDLGRVKFVPPDAENYTSVQASAAAESWGYNQALDNLIYFREYFLETTQPKADKVADLYGALEKVVADGDLSEGEADAIRTDSPIPEPTVVTWDSFQRNLASNKQQ